MTSVASQNKRTWLDPNMKVIAPASEGFQNASVATRVPFAVRDGERDSNGAGGVWATQGAFFKVASRYWTTC